MSKSNASLHALAASIPGAPSQDDPRYNAFLSALQQKMMLQQTSKGIFTFLQKGAAGARISRTNSQQQLVVPVTLPAIHQPLVTKEMIKSLVEKIDGDEKLDGDVEDLVSEIVQDFVRDAIEAACHLAKHRKSERISVKDVQLHLGI